MFRATLALRRSFSPLSDRVLVSRTIAETKSAGGILLPGAEKPTNEGVVEAVGPGMLMENGTTSKMNVVVGDKVLLPEYGGTKVEMDGEDKFLYREMDILGKF
ncbi:hypothetical protein TrLO_g14300 [Triparma laevis f. longispina]|uniref:20 kDa chaperonin, chloroplastic n=1 Tax=Triparma laevis f. longispina TaxID=1714387 RepID=A0A9W7CGA6_9STRA|nr:hypothetical protein TrLO_g14300 [Triparma laevis f. longispina]